MRYWRKATKIGISMWLFVFLGYLEDLNGETETLLENLVAFLEKYRNKRSDRGDNI